MKKALSCGAVVVRFKETGPEILLIKQFAHKETWGIPKGHIHDGESQHECALREVREETGLVVELGERLPEVEAAWDNKKKTVISFMASAVGSDVPSTNDPDCEIADVRWFPIDSLPKVVAYQRPLLEHVNATLKK